MSKPPTAAQIAYSRNLANNIGWKPRAWKKSDRRLWNGNGRRKPRGKRYTISPAAKRRKSRSLAKRKA